MRGINLKYTIGSGLVSKPKLKYWGWTKHILDKRRALVVDRYGDRIGNIGEKPNIVGCAYHANRHLYVDSEGIVECQEAPQYGRYDNKCQVEQDRS